jgi:hypothetical protein
MNDETRVVVPTTNPVRNIQMDRLFQERIERKKQTKNRLFFKIRLFFRIKVTFLSEFWSYYS